MPAKKPSTPDHMRIGQIVGGFGIKGLVKVEPLTEFVERFEKGSRLRLEGEWVTVESVSVHKGRLLLKLSGVEDLTAAEKLQWKYLEVPAGERPELDDDEFYTADLIGLEVVDEQGRRLGPVDDVLAYPAQDILKVGDRLIPMVREFVLDIDLASKRIRVRLLDGM